MFSLLDRTAIVTGSSRGIGRAIATALARAGAKVVITSRKSDACEATVSELRAEGLEATSIPCNISSKEQVTRLVSETERVYGPADVLVCNAAINPYYGPMSGISDEAFSKIMDVNIRSNLWLVNAVAPKMATKGKGAITIVSSIEGLQGSRDIGAYAISKAADMQLARNLALEWGKSGVRVNCLAPGLVRTDFAKALWDDPATLASCLASSPLGMIGEPDDIAGAALLLASDAGKFITGTTIVIDGGATIGGNV